MSSHEWDTRKGVWPLDPVIPSTESRASPGRVCASNHPPSTRGSLTHPVWGP
jgi:hypothetical protein